MALIQINMDEMNLLLVDDSRTDRLLLKAILEDIGIGSIRQAEDGGEALKILQTFPADLVLCDLHMAPMDGIEFIRQLRTANTSPNPFLPTLMLTADATSERLNEALKAGVNGFLGKPIKPETMRRQIQSIFSRPLVFVREDCCFVPLRASPQAGAPASKPKTNGQAEATPAAAKPAKPATAAKPKTNGRARAATQPK